MTSHWLQLVFYGLFSDTSRMETLAERITYARSKMSLTQAEFAEKVGVTQRQITRYESGSAEPRPGTIMRIAQVSGVGYSWLKHGEGPSEPLVVLPDELRRLLRGAADTSGRSLNEEIIHRLEKSFSSPSSSDEMKALEKKLAELDEEMTEFKKAYIEASDFIKELRDLEEKRKK